MNIPLDRCWVLYISIRCKSHSKFVTRRQTIMSTEDRAKATAKNVEGKAQEALGNVTGDTEDQAKGKAKQAQAEASHAKEDVKDGVKDAID